MLETGQGRRWEAEPGWEEELGRGAGGPLCRQQVPPARAAASRLPPVRSWVKARLVRSMAGLL